MEVISARIVNTSLNPNMRGAKITVTEVNGQLFNKSYGFFNELGYSILKPHMKVVLPTIGKNLH